LATGIDSSGVVEGVEGTLFPKYFWRNAVPLNGANPGTHKGFKGLVGGQNVGYCSPWGVITPPSEKT